MASFRVGDCVRVSLPVDPAQKGRVGIVESLIPGPQNVEQLDRYLVGFVDETKRFWSTELQLVEWSSGTDTKTAAA